MFIGIGTEDEIPSKIYVGISTNSTIFEIALPLGAPLGQNHFFTLPSLCKEAFAKIIH